MSVHSLLDEQEDKCGSSDIQADPIEQLFPDQAEVRLKHKVEEMVEYNIQVRQQGLHNHYS